MKSKLLILSLLLCLNSFGQVPNTESFDFQTVANILSYGNLSGAFSEAADPDLFDPKYYPHYLPTGSNYGVENSLINFRNYGGTHDGIPVPVATGAIFISNSSFTATWNESEGADGYYIDISIYSDFSSMTYDNYYCGDVTGFTTSGWESNLTLYYRVRASTLNGQSANSNICKLKIATKWFLPSRTEWNYIRGNLWTYGIGNFISDTYYWTSEESDATHSWSMRNSVQEEFLKALTFRVRPVKSFITSSSYSLREELADGSFVFLVVDNGDGTYKYWSCYPSDISTGYLYSNVNSAIGTTDEDGYANTLEIIGQAGHTSSAAKLCYDL